MVRASKLGASVSLAPHRQMIATRINGQMRRLCSSVYLLSSTCTCTSQHAFIDIAKLQRLVTIVNLKNAGNVTTLFVKCLLYTNTSQVYLNPFKPLNQGQSEDAPLTFTQIKGLSQDVSIINVWMHRTNGPLFIVLHKAAVAWIGFLPNSLMQLWQNRKLSQ